MKVALYWLLNMMKKMEICDKNDKVVHGFIFYLSLDINCVDKSYFCFKNTTTHTVSCIANCSQEGINELNLKVKHMFPVEFKILL